MKKILSILSAITITGTSAALAVSCAVPTYTIYTDTKNITVDDIEDNSKKIDALNGSLGNASFSDLVLGLTNLLTFRKEMVVKTQKGYEQLSNYVSKYKSTTASTENIINNGNTSVPSKTIDGTYFDLTNDSSASKEVEFYKTNQGNTLYTRSRADALGSEDFENLYLNDNSSDKGIFSIGFDSITATKYDTPTIGSTDTKEDDKTTVSWNEDSTGQDWNDLNDGWSDTYKDGSTSYSAINILGTEMPTASDIKIEVEDSSEKTSYSDDSSSDWSIKIVKNDDGYKLDDNQSKIVKCSDVGIDLTYVSNIKKASEQKVDGDADKLTGIDVYHIKFNVSGLAAVFVPVMASTLLAKDSTNSSKQVFWEFDHYQWNSTWNTNEEHEEDGIKFEAGEGLFNDIQIGEMTVTKSN